MVVIGWFLKVGSAKEAELIHNYLDQKYMMLLKRKIELLENEIKNKMIELTLNNYNQVQDEEELTRRR